MRFHEVIVSTMLRNMRTGVLISEKDLPLIRHANSPETGSKSVMIFDELIKLVNLPDSDIRICCDSRSVQPGDVFVAVVGSGADGHDFISRAIASGARYIVCEKRHPQQTDVNIIEVANSAVSLGILAQAGYSRPGDKLINMAVTGTNGKTTVCYLVRSIIQAAGEKCGVIGTIAYDTGDESENASLTTPGALEIARLTRKMVDSGTAYLAIEASSHALSQHRLSGIDFTAAAFTNLTGDHLDYHKTTKRYLDAKARLFHNLKDEAMAVLNRQSEAAKDIGKQTRARKIWYAVDEAADISACVHSMNARKTCYTISLDGKKEHIETALTGIHNVSNQLAAAGLCFAAGFDIETIARGISDLSRVPGRLDPVDCGQNFTVLVDYAHTDDALINVLSTLRTICTGKLTVVFGCGGDRDKTKRPRMAQVAEEMADTVVVTSDNPRTENPDAIIEDICRGFMKPNAKNITIAPDRKKAIATALTAAEKNDIVLIAGKGHEDYQIIADRKIHFDDREVATEILENIACTK